MKTFDKKYRPKTFKTLIGNEVIKRYFSSEANRMPSSILLYGTTGCGKTTIARIIANQNKAETFELNISNTRGIDNARSIISQANTSSMLGAGKIFILNEIHKATNEFMNAMLEILEEPPSNVSFILCTTDPEKLLPAIRSRCTSFNVSKLDHEEAKQLIDRVVKKEDIAIDKKHYRDIILAGEGIPRKILLILDSISITGTTEKEIKKAISQYSYIEGDESPEVIELCRKLLRGTNFKEVMDSLKEIKDEPETIRRIICSYMSKVLLGGKLNKNAASILDVFVDTNTSIGQAAIIRALALIFME